jgi:hypothetical protein
MPDHVHDRPCSGPEPHEETELESQVPIEGRITPEARKFYRRAILTVQDAGIPVLVGGAFAFEFYTGISRHTKDFDIFVRAQDATRTLELMSAAGYVTEVTAPHWLAKVCSGDAFVDIIFGEANGVREVNDEWFEQAVRRNVLGLDLLLCPVEEMIGSKAFVMDRDRFDGADVAHLLRQHAEKLDWDRLLRRFGGYWHVLLSHLLLFRFIYPSERGRIPVSVMRELLRRLNREMSESPSTERVCRGTLVSMSQYSRDITRWGYEDARELKEAL